MSSRFIKAGTEDIQALRQFHRDWYTTAIRKQTGQNVPPETADRWWPGTTETPVPRKKVSDGSR